ncbi:MAG TPA: GIY-YIG nuclease family protein [Chloroflexi bacterium]|nr:GIY-YIG nuclease family protein [Chloroflexota bacterium]
MKIARLTPDAADALPAAPGSYLLILYAERSAEITIGRLGSVQVIPGWYLYTGSALGPGGLRGRVRHHLRPVTRPHWHIDYLRQACTVTEVWYMLDARRWEHLWSTMLSQFASPIPGFGASDCRCVAHAFYLAHPPTSEAIGTFLVSDLQTVAQLDEGD